MERFQQIDEMLRQQAQIMEELTREIDRLKSDDIAVQNDALRTALATAEEQLQQRVQTVERLEQENKRLKNELYEQMFNEKAQMLQRTEERLNAYFQMHEQPGQNRLSLFEAGMKRQMDQITAQLTQNQVELEHSSYQALQDLREQVNGAILAARQEAERARAELHRHKVETMEDLRAEPLTGEQMAARAKQNNLESFLGLKILNKLGIFLIVVGVIAAVQFTYTYIPDALKGALAFVFGIVMLACGELVNRKRPDVFSLGLTAGGIAILYAATALSFFFLQILSMYPALLLCILITALAFVLSQRYNTQTVAVFAVVGGYLPIFSIGDTEALTYYAMGYFLLLNGFSLLISVYKKWQVSQYVSFFMNLGATFYLLAQLRDSSLAGAAGFAVAYTFLTFVLYTAIPVLSSYRTGTKLQQADNVLLIFNTVFGSLVMFWVFLAFDLWAGAGLMTIVLCLVYFAAAIIVQKKLAEETTSQVLFYITGLTFAVLTIPIQLDVAYLSLGWLVQGTLLLCYGIWKERRGFFRAGVVISALCLFVFLTLDTMLQGPLFFYKYLFVTLAAALDLAMLTAKRKAVAGGGQIYQGIVIVNTWFFLLFACREKLYPFLQAATAGSALASHFTLITAILLSLGYAYAIVRIGAMTGRGVPVISTVIYVLAILGLLSANTGNDGVYRGGSAAIAVLGTLLILAVNLLAVFAMRDLILRLTLGKKLGLEWYPLILSAFFIFVMLQNLIVVFDLSLNNILITGVLAGTALGWILFGFAKRYLYIRLSGLGLSFLTVVKLFVIDLSFLTQGMRIISYFLMGATLLAISFIYQRVSKRLDAVTGEVES